MTKATIIRQLSHRKPKALDEAIAGPLFEQIDPEFTHDFVKHIPYVQQLVIRLLK